MCRARGGGGGATMDLCDAKRGMLTKRRGCDAGPRPVRVEAAAATVTTTTTAARVRRDCSARAAVGRGTCSPLSALRLNRTVRSQTTSQPHAEVRITTMRDPAPDFRSVFEECSVFFARATYILRHRSQARIQTFFKQFFAGERKN